MMMRRSVRITITVITQPTCPNVQQILYKNVNFLVTKTHLMHSAVGVLFCPVCGVTSVRCAVLSGMWCHFRSVCCSVRHVVSLPFGVLFCPVCGVTSVRCAVLSSMWCHFRSVCCSVQYVVSLPFASWPMTSNKNSDQTKDREPLQYLACVIS